MTTLLRTFAFLFFAASVTTAIAQPNNIGYRVKAPFYVVYDSLDATKKGVRNDTTFLMWRHKVRVPHPNLGVGDVVKRQTSAVVEGKAETVTYWDTLTAVPTVVRDSTSRATSRPGEYANVYPDTEDPSTLHVNFWLSRGDSIRWRGPDGDSLITGEELRNVEYFYKLRNRQSIRLSYRTWPIGGTTVPLRYYPGYEDEGVDVGGDFTTDFNVGLYVGRTWGSVSYTYNRHAEALQESSRAITLAVFATLTVAELDSTNTLTASNPLSAKTSEPFLSVGPMLGMRAFGAEVGLFLGFDYGLSGTAQRWDYHGRYWWGVGIGYKLFKL